MFIPASTATLSVAPLEQGKKSHVEISTTMNTSPGLKGFVERIVVPIVNPPTYRKELKLLEAVTRKRGNHVTELNQS